MAQEEQQTAPSKDQEEKRVDKVDINSWITEIKAGQKELEGVSDKQVRIIIHHLFMKLNNDLSQFSQNGSIRMSGLGRFRIAHGTRKTGEAFKHIFYAPDTQHLGRWAMGDKSS